MATRSTIALEHSDGTVQSVYCHFDGYLSHNGNILQEHYSDPAKLQELIALGSMSSLAKEIGQQHPFTNPFQYGSDEYNAFRAQYQNWCVFYSRDRGEDLVINEFADLKAYILQAEREEYNYILRQIDGSPVWFVESHETDGFIRLDEALQSEILEE